MNAHLKQQLGVFSALMVVISAMIGSGVFKKIAPMSDLLHHSGWVLLAWALAGLITLMGSLSNAEVAGIIAKPGGQYVYFQEMYGKVFAFLFGWASFSVIQTATASAVAFIFAESLNNLLNAYHCALPNLPDSIAQITIFHTKDFDLMPFANFGVKSLAMGLVLILSFINYRGIEYGEKIGNILGGTVIIGVLFIIILSFYKGENSDLFSQTTSINNAGLGEEKSFISLFFLAMVAAFWAYEGWNNVGFLAGEIKNPKKNIPIALSFGTLVVIILYLLVNAAFYKVGDVSFFQTIAGQSNTIAAVEAMNKIWIYGGLFISLLILVSTFNSTNNSLMSAPRIYYAMAVDGLFLKSASEIHPKFKTPYKAIVMQMFWCLVLIITGSFDMLTEMLVFVAFIFYGCGAFGVIILRKKMPTTHRPFKVPLYPILPLAFTLFSLVLVINTLIESPGKSCIGLGLVLLGFPIYKMLQRKQ
ncbi:MAG: amino acid permease [bacterium]|nr:amino acid permease [bacterium]